jgi:glyoxylase-like metal-dependent hydrolase (beta-lactamase superfamily II)
MEDNEEVPLGASRFRFLHTRGHANHHMCIHDPALATVYTGDAFGLRYPALQRSGLFVFPSTSPTDFDGKAALESIDRIVSCGARSVRPTHFGEVEDVVGAAVQLRSHLEYSSRLLERTILEAPEDGMEKWVLNELRKEFERVIARDGHSFGNDEWSWINLDLELNAAGLAFVARKCRV